MITFKNYVNEQRMNEKVHMSEYAKNLKVPDIEDLYGKLLSCWKSYYDPKWNDDEFEELGDKIYNELKNSYDQSNVEFCSDIVMQGLDEKNMSKSYKITNLLDDIKETADRIARKGTEGSMVERCLEDAIDLVKKYI